MSAFEAVAFALTDKCSAACGICCFSCSPEKNKLLDIDLIKNYIRQAYEFGSIKTIAFTGGEAILYYEQLKECVACAKSFGMKATLVTNGFWARNEKKGFEMISELKDAGLTNISISVDGFHQEYVPYETVRKALDITDRLGLLSAVTVMEEKDGHHIQESMENLKDILYNRAITVYPVFPAGSAAHNVPAESIIRECRSIDAQCAFDRSVTVLFDGVMRFCCSQFSHKIGLTKLGVFGETSIKEAAEEFEKNDFIYVLIKKQFKWFIDWADEFGLRVDEKYSISCELCHYLFSNDDFVEYLRPRVKEEADRLRFEKIFS